MGATGRAIGKPDPEGQRRVGKGLQHEKVGGKACVYVSADEDEGRKKAKKRNLIYNDTPPIPFPLFSYRLFPSGSHYSGTMCGRVTKGKKKNVACFFPPPLRCAAEIGLRVQIPPLFLPHLYRFPLLGPNNLLHFLHPSVGRCGCGCVCVHGAPCLIIHRYVPPPILTYVPR